MLGKTTFQQAVTAAWAPAVAGTRLVTGTLDGGGVGFSEDEAALQVHAVDLTTGALQLRSELRVNGSRFGVLRWGGANNDQIAAGMTDGTVRLWTYQNDNLKELSVLQVHDKGTAVKGLSFNPVVKDLLAHGGADKRVLVTDLASNSATSGVTESSTHHVGEVSCVAWNYETPHILSSASMDGVCSVWDTRSRKSFSDIRDPRSASTTVVAWSPRTGFHMVTGSDSGFIRLFDLRSSKSTPLAELQAHTAGVFDIAWCPQDPGYLASCGKDNRLVVWDLYTLQPIQEVTTEVIHNPKTDHQGFSLDNTAGFGTATGFSADALFSGSGNISDLGGGPGAGSRRYQIAWSNTAPGLLSACAFDRSVQMLPLITNASGLLGSTGQKLRAPAWMARKCSVTFGFGGRLVSAVEQSEDPKSIEVRNCHSCFAEGNAASRMSEFERGFNQALQHDAGGSHDHLAAFCAERVSQSTDETERQVWSFMRVLFEEEQPRIAIGKFLGFDEDAVAREVDLSVLPQLEDNEQNEANVSATIGDNLDNDTPVDELILRALTVGNFEAAVAICLTHGREADALALSSLGGEQLMRRTHRAYLNAQASSRRVMRLARAVFNDNAAGTVVQEANLKKPGAWKQTLAFLMTYTKVEDFPNECDALARRLEFEENDLGAATVCYMLSRNIGKSAELWLRLDPKDEVGLVEKAVVFQQVLADPNALLGDAMMMQRFTRLASRLADEGEFTIAFKYAEMAQHADESAQDLASRLSYGLNWNAESEALAAQEAALQAAAAAAEAERLAQEQAAANVAYHGNGYNSHQGYTQHGYSDSYGQPLGYSSQQGFAPPPSAPPVAENTFTFAAPQAQVYVPPTQQVYTSTFAPAQTAHEPAAPAYQVSNTQANGAYGSGRSGASVIQQQPGYGQQYGVSTPSFPIPPSVPSTSIQHQTIAPSAVVPAPTITQLSAGGPAVTTSGPRVKENDGFGSTVGNPDAAARYGNRQSGAVITPPSQQVQTDAPPPKPPKVPEAMVPVMQSFSRTIVRLKSKYPGGLEERRLKEAEKSEEVLRSAIAVGSVSEYFQGKLREMASALENGQVAEAHNIHIALSSSADWKEHKGWLKGFGHLIAVAQKDVQPVEAAAPVGPPTGPPPVAPPPAYSQGAYAGPPPTGPSGGPTYPSQAPSLTYGGPGAGPSYGGPGLGPSYSAAPTYPPPPSGGPSYPDSGPVYPATYYQ